MDWSRIPTNLITDRLPDKEIVAIVKYQLLWAYLEREPDEITAQRYLTKTQIKVVEQYKEAMTKLVMADIKSVVAKRGVQKLIYAKNKELSKNLTSIPSAVIADTQYDSKQEHIRQEETTLNNKKTNNNTSQHTAGFVGIPIPLPKNFI